jgi:hypothetical protein
MLAVGETRNVYKNLVAKPEGKCTLGGHMHSWEDNIMFGLKEIGCEGVK